MKGFLERYFGIMREIYTPILQGKIETRGRDAVGEGEEKAEQQHPLQLGKGSQVKQFAFG